jgi:hypothetical protein
MIKSRKWLQRGMQPQCNSIVKEDTGFCGFDDKEGDKDYDEDTGEGP